MVSQAGGKLAEKRVWHDFAVVNRFLVRHAGRDILCHGLLFLFQDYTTCWRERQEG